MSVYTVARDDFRNARRSYVVLGVIGVFTALCALIFVSERNIYDDPYRTLFDLSFFTALVLPLFLAPLTYVSITGERQSGVIQYVMGLPNARHGYVLAKFASRLGVAVVAVLSGVAISFVVALFTFENAPDVGRFAAFAFVSVLYAFSFVGLYVGVSAATAKRSRAMLGVFGLYFLLIPFWFGFFPIVSLQTLLDTITSLLGVTISEQTRVTIRALSPANAYLVSTEIVYEGVLTEYERIARNFGQERSDWLYRQFWFDVLVMVAWGTVPVLLGYLSFARSELA